MKLRYVSILLVLLLAVTLAVSGCTTTTTSTPTPSQGTQTVTATPAAGATTTTSATAAATAAPSTGAADTLGSLYKMGQLKWFEYQFTTDMGEGQTMTMKAKTEFLGTGVDPKDGVEGQHMRITSTTTIPGMGPQTNTMDVYSKPNAGSSTSSSDYTSSNAQLVNAGPDTVTVPAGTFACTKYTVTQSQDGTDVTQTFWSSPQAPVPVKFTATVGGETANYELTGWG